MGIGSTEVRGNQLSGFKEVPVKTDCRSVRLRNGGSVKNIAVIGAGVSGLSAALELSRSGCRVVVFEKSRGLSGRAATRRRGALSIDHGANFFRTTDEEVAHLIHELLPSDDLVEVRGDVWTFNRDGVITEGDPKLNAEPKFSYRRGISTLGKLLQEFSGVEVHRNQRVTRLHRDEQGWKVENEAGDIRGEYDSVIVTIPAPQAAELMRACAFPESLHATFADALAISRYDPQFSFMLGFRASLPLVKRFHALVNSDGEHPVSWLSFEDDKPGHVPDGSSLLVVQMSGWWSSAHLDDQPEKLLPEVFEHTSALLPEVENMPDWWDSQRWLLAAPRNPVDVRALEEGEAIGLYFAGDGMVGRGRIPLAINSGLACARKMCARSLGGGGVSG